VKKLLIATSFLITLGHFAGFESFAATPPSKTASHKKLQVAGVTLSPYYRKVIVTILEKGLNYSPIKTLPAFLLKATGQPVPEALLKIPTNSEGKIPVLIENEPGSEEFSMDDSRVIMNYVNNIEKSNPLRPQCPKANARVDRLSIYGDEILGTLTHKIAFETIVKPQVLSEKTDSALVSENLTKLQSVLDELEKILSDGRNWIADTKNISLADITVVSHLETLTLANQDLMGLIGHRTYLKQYVAKMLERKSFKEAMKDI